MTEFSILFRVHINKYWYFWRVIIKLYILYKVLIYQYWYIMSYYPTTHIFHSSNKWLLTNTIIKTFSEFISNNINIFRELRSNNTDFFRVYVKQWIFSDKVTTNIVDYFHINYTKESFRFRRPHTYQVWI